LKAITTGLMTLFNAAPGGVNNSFWTDITGRLFDTEAPDGAEFPFAVYFIVSDTDEDTFKDPIRRLYIQFSLFSDKSSSTEIKDMDTHLTALFRDNLFTVNGYGTVMMFRIQGNGPTVTPADVEAGTGRFWQYDIDFEGVFQKT
jgi:hypothetical protein